MVYSIYRETSYLFYLFGPLKKPFDALNNAPILYPVKDDTETKQLGIKNYKNLFFFIGGFLKAGTQSQLAIGFPHDNFGLSWNPTCGIY